MIWPDECQSELLLESVRLVKAENSKNMWKPSIERLNVHKTTELVEYKDVWPYTTELWKVGLKIDFTNIYSLFLFVRMEVSKSIIDL